MNDWHDVNDPGSFSFRTKKTVEKKVNEYSAEDLFDYSPIPKEKVFKEIKFNHLNWIPGSVGFQFNHDAIVSVSASYLAKTSNRKITGELFVIYNGVEENLRCTSSSHLDDKGNANLNFKLYYGEHFYKDFKNDPSLKCKYICKVKHKTTDIFTGDPLEMPAIQTVNFKFSR